MPLKNSETLSNGWKKDSFDTTPIMSTYLLAFVVADFRSREKTMTSGLKVRPCSHVCEIVSSLESHWCNWFVLQIRIWAQPDSYDQTEYALDFAVAAYKFFADYFGMPEVVPKAGEWLHFNAVWSELIPHWHITITTCLHPMEDHALAVPMHWTELVVILWYNWG